MIDVERVLRAIAAVESGGGDNNYPRFEVSYAPAGKAFTVQGRVLRGTGRNWNPIVAERWARWGMPSACSYGPWQILYHTAADLGYDGNPVDLWWLSENWVRKRLDRIMAKGANTVELIADAWNSGTHKDANTVPEYRAKVLAAYGDEEP